MKREHFADAIPMFEAARAAAVRAGAKSIANRALANIANCYESLGNFNQALTVLEKSVAEQKSSGLATYLSDDYSELGVIRLRMGQSSEAISFFHQAFAVVNKDAPVQYSTAASNLANVLQETGSLDEAQHFNERGLPDSTAKTSKSDLGFLALTDAGDRRKERLP